MKRLYKSLAIGLCALTALFGIAPASAIEISPLPANPKETKTTDLSVLKSHNGLSRLATSRAAQNPESRLAAATPGTYTIKGVTANRASSGIIRRSYDQPRSIMHAIVPMFQGIVSTNESFFGKVDLSNGQLTKIYSGSEYYMDQTMADFVSGAVRNGILYIPKFSQDMVTGEMAAYWNRVNLEDGTELSPISFGDDLLGFSYTLCYDPVRDKFYGVAYDAETDQFGEFVAYDGKYIEQGQGVVEYIGNVGGSTGNFITAICYNPADQQVYAIKDNGTMGILDVDYHGDFLIVKEFTEDEYYAFGYAGSSQPLEYSPRDRAFVTVYQNYDTETFDLVFIDADSFDCTLGSSLSQVALTAEFICLDQYADDLAPALPAINSVDVEGNSLSGSITITAPTERYDGIIIAADKLVSLSLTVDDNVIYEGQLAPGASTTVDFTLEEGEHIAKLTPSFSASLVGPFAQTKFYVGNDTPSAPANVAVTGNTITWSAPTTGAHQGYIDPEQLTYNVYFNGALVNDTPVEGTSYTFVTPESFERRNITVTAIYESKESAPSDAVTLVFGKADELPVSYTPTYAESSKFQAIDADHDGVTFEYETRYGESFGCNTPYYTTANDWLVMPLISFPDANGVYTLRFSLGAYYPDSSYLNDMEICLGKDATISALNNKIYEHSRLECGSAEEYVVTFTVPEAGDYYIGFHITGLDSKYRGARLSSFSVRQQDGTSAGRPGSLTNITAAAAPQGELSANVEFTAPTLDMNGDALAADEALTITLECGFNSRTVSATPGQSVSTSIEVDQDGWTQIMLTPSSAAGQGATQRAVAYVGNDIPLSPANIRSYASADNRTIHISWDPVTEGENGGYVNPDDLKYALYSKYGITYTKLGETKELSYDYTVTTDKLKAYYLGPVASTSMGDSKNSEFVLDYLGDPYPIPMIEDFPVGGTSFTYGPWNYNAEEGYKDFAWRAITSMSGLKIGEGSISLSALACDGLGQKGYSELIVPKFTTKGSTEAAFSTKFWVYPGCPDEVSIYGRRYGSEELVLLKVLPFESPEGNAHWEELGFNLPAEFQDADWVQLRIRTHFPGLTENEVALFDDVKIYQNVDYDYKALSVDGPAELCVGDKAEYSFSVINSGQERNAAKVYISLVGDGQTLSMRRYNVSRLLSNRTYTQYYTFEMLESYVNYEKLQVVLNVEGEQDEVAHNNTLVKDIYLRDSNTPVVRDLAGAWTDDDKSGVQLTWSTPVTDRPGYETFEYETPFAQVGNENLGVWKNIDIDGAVPFCIDGARWENDEEPCAWTVIDTKPLNFDTDERLAAHSGRKYIMARSIQTEDYTAEADQIQAHDMLISPEIVGGSQVSFWLNTLSSSYKETVGVWYSTTDREPESFTMLRPLTKSGEEAWELVTVTLPENAKYFALEYRSYPNFGMMIDDITYEPASPYQWNIEYYDVYCYDNDDWNTFTQLAHGLKDTSFVDNAPSENRRYYVVPVVRTEDGKLYSSPRSNMVQMIQSAVADLAAGTVAIYGVKGAVVIAGCNGLQAKVYGSDGKLAALTTLNSDSEPIAMQPGVYVVKVANTTAKVVVK